MAPKRLAGVLKDMDIILAPGKQSDKRKKGQATPTQPVGKRMRMDIKCDKSPVSRSCQPWQFLCCLPDNETYRESERCSWLRLLEPQLASSTCVEREGASSRLEDLSVEYEANMARKEKYYPRNGKGYRRDETRSGTAVENSAKTNGIDPRRDDQVQSTEEDPVAGLVLLYNKGSCSACMRGKAGWELPKSSRYSHLYLSLVE